jgi:hypothetical protein
MPTMHRLACFRDDIIFFIYLYQRWIYNVDTTRVNEFGQGGDDAASDNTSVVSTEPKSHVLGEVSNSESISGDLKEQ